METKQKNITYTDPEDQIFFEGEKVSNLNNKKIFKINEDWNEHFLVKYLKTVCGRQWEDQWVQC